MPRVRRGVRAGIQASPEREPPRGHRGCTLRIAQGTRRRGMPRHPLRKIPKRTDRIRERTYHLWQAGGRTFGQIRHSGILGAAGIPDRHRGRTWDGQLPNVHTKPDCVSGVASLTRERAGKRRSRGRGRRKGKAAAPRVDAVWRGWRDHDHPATPARTRIDSFK